MYVGNGKNIDIFSHVKPEDDISVITDQERYIPDKTEEEWKCLWVYKELVKKQKMHLTHSDGMIDVQKTIADMW